jgi:RNA polymerase sigma factor (sigma-70 family)
MAGPLLFLNSDARILDLINKGDEGALVTLYDQNRRPVQAFVTRNHGSLEDADDMLQEALVILWERVRTRKFEYGARLSTFIYATVKNLWHARLRVMKREVPFDVDKHDTDNDEQSSLEGLIQQEQRDQMHRALERLGELCRKLLLMFYWEEMSMETIASNLGLANADVAKSKKYQCKKELQALLKTHMQDND